MSGLPQTRVRRQLWDPHGQHTENSQKATTSDRTASSHLSVCLQWWLQRWRRGLNRSGDSESTKTTNESPNGPMLLNFPNKTSKRYLLLTIKYAIFYFYRRQKEKGPPIPTSTCILSGIICWSPTVYHWTQLRVCQSQSVNTGDHIATAESLTVFLLCHHFRAPAAYLPKRKYRREMLTAAVQYLPENLVRDQNCELNREFRLELASTPKGSRHLLEGLQMLPVSSDKETVRSLYYYY